VGGTHGKSKYHPACALAMAGEANQQINKSTNQ
jgi:hypothetical protein